MPKVTWMNEIPIDEEVPAGVSLKELVAAILEDEDSMVNFKAPQGFKLKLTGTVFFRIVPVEE